MSARRSWLGAICLLLTLLGIADAQQPAQTPPPQAEATPAAEGEAIPADAPPPGAPVIDAEKLAREAKKSLVTITFADRDGTQGGMGTGFVISADGLIATNLHVIGEARPISVQFADGKKFDVQEVHASERSLDLAIVKIDAKDLSPLALGESKDVQQGQSVVALGNPLGLEFSVVAGLVSGQREIDGKPMLQLAIPIEPGNSGGPVLDASGRVLGVMTMKSVVTRNLGFAVESDALKPLLAKPNPVPMSRWLTIGRLDAKEWTTHEGGQWRQRAGRITVSGQGDGFGGRCFCLNQNAAPEVPFEAAVAVKLDSEEGAAGLVFCADGDRHYGFYPTGGKLRLTRFEGPTVLSWTILDTLPCEQYKPGEWNTLKVRVEKDRLQCFVNDELVVETGDGEFRDGRIGLAKFRETAAQFKQFQVGATVAASRPDKAVVESVGKLVADIPAEGDVDHLAERLLEEDAPTSDVLRERADLLERQAEQIRRLAAEVHARRVTEELAKLMRQDEAEIDLFHAGLLIARLDNDELDVAAYRRQLDRIAGEIKERLPAEADDAARLAALNEYLFKEHGFHGSRTNYYNRSNSYLNEVLDDREGLPIALAVLYMELGRRVGLNVEGVGLPGHFVVRLSGAAATNEDDRLIDVFDGGTPLDLAAAEALAGQKLTGEQLAAASKKSIVIRMIVNLLGLAQNEQDLPRMSRYLDAVLAVAPESGYERFMRAVLRFQLKRFDAAEADIEWLLEHSPDNVDLDRVRQLRDAIAAER